MVEHRKLNIAMIPFEFRAQDNMRCLRSSECLKKRKIGRHDQPRMWADIRIIKFCVRLFVIS